MTASWSLNEIEALSRKAARGAGYDWGMAEEAGRAVRWLAARALPGAEALVQLLTWRDRVPGALLCPINLGTQLIDGQIRAEAEPRSLGPVSAPLLLLPFAAWAAVTSERAIGVSWASTAFAVTAEGAAFQTGPAATPDDATVTLCADAAAEGAALVPKFRAAADLKTVETLAAFAGRTYAPATEASRQSGAGAGVLDND